MRLTAQLIAMTVAGALVSGCFGDDGVDPDDLEGTWLGTTDDPTTNGGVVSTEITFDDDGNITRVLENGNSTGNTATLDNQFGRKFDFTFSNGDSASAILSESGEHLAMIATDSQVAVLEKGRQSLPRFSAQDLPGSYDGREFVVDGSFRLMAEIDSSLTVQSTPAPVNFTLDEQDVPNCEYSGTLSAPAAGIGVSTGSFSPSGGSGCFLSSNGDAISYLTGDKRFALLLLCQSIGQFPTDCSWAPMAKQ